jgi:hypothetical protein
MHDVRLTPTERKVYDATDVRKPGVNMHAIVSLEMSLDAWRFHRKNIRRKLGIVVTERAHWRRPAAPKPVSHRDPLEDETPREARARVAKDLAEGRRCTAPMLRGPCSLLLPCATHGR